MKIEIIVKCVGCGNKRTIKGGELEAGDFPMCEKCFMPMFPVKAIGEIR